MARCLFQLVVRHRVDLGSHSLVDRLGLSCAVQLVRLLSYISVAMAPFWQVVHVSLFTVR
jgi:hypothetical protein